jgi:23S rRNA (guanosine2251-2'-O)-methyltransferase
MGPSANNFSDRRRPVRRGERPGPGPSPRPRETYREGPRETTREGSREGSRGRPSRGPNDSRPTAAAPFRRRGPRSEGEAPIEGRRWSRDRVERPGREDWRRGEGAGRPAKPTTTQDRRPWRLPRREEAPARPFRPVRGERPPLVSEAPRGEAHADAAPSDLIWGRHSAQAALESERPIHRVWCTAEMRFRPPFLQLLREAKASGVLVEEVTWARLGQLSGGAVHQGIVLQPAAADTLDLPSLIEGCRQLEESPLLVAVDGLTDPQNLGAILRSAEALGVHGLVLPQRRNAGLTGSVAKVAAGALEHLPVARVVNLNRALESLRQEGYRVVGLDSQGSVSLEEADLDGPLVVITGSEGQGLSLLTRRSCDQLVRIPLRGITPSLNASVATALVLYEVARRGWMRGLRGMAKPPRLVRPTVPTQPLETPAAPDHPPPPLQELAAPVAQEPAAPVAQEPELAAPVAQELDLSEAAVEQPAVSARHDEPDRTPHDAPDLTPDDGLMSPSAESSEPASAFSADIHL